MGTITVLFSHAMKLASHFSTQFWPVITHKELPRHILYIYCVYINVTLNEFTMSDSFLISTDLSNIPELFALNQSPYIKRHIYIPHHMAELVFHLSGFTSHEYQYPCGAQ